MLQLALAEHKECDSNECNQFISEPRDSFPKSLELLPESNQYHFDDEDQKISDHLYDKNKEQIQEFKDFGDDIIFRFVSGYRHIKYFSQRLQQTNALFSDYLQWRKSCGYESILNITHIKEVAITQYIEGCYIYGQNIYGHPVFYDEGLKYCSDSDMSMYKTCGKEGIDKVLAFTMRLLQKMKDATNEYYGLQTKLNYVEEEETLIMTQEKDNNGENINSDKKHKIGVIRHCVVINLSEFDVVRVLKDVKQHEYFFTRFSALFPECIHKAYVINTPLMFRTVWKLVKGFLHPNTVEKTVILGKNYTQELFKEIHPDFVPKKFGGNGSWDIVYGDIPKKYPIKWL